MLPILGFGTRDTESVQSGLAFSAMFDVVPNIGDTQKDAMSLASRPLRRHKPFALGSPFSPMKRYSRDQQ